MYKAPVLAGSPIPALWGLRSLQEHRALIDTFNNKLIEVGPGGYELKLSPGSIIHNLIRAPSGHLILPITEYARKKTQLPYVSAAPTDAVYQETPVVAETPFPQFQ